jgi:Fe-S cluster assembly ATP-binding protein
MLEIHNLHVTVDGKAILQGFNLTVRPGEIHAIMGPNGAGKSTLAKALAGHPSYEVTQGSILFKGTQLTELEPEERAHLGLFMSFQYPIEIGGCSNFDFLFAIKHAQLKARGQAALSQEEFRSLLAEKLQIMNIREEFLTRDINSGFSGGEKKRNEILQMALLEPTLAILDETDSGLDIDAMKIVAEGIKKQMNPNNALILITHYQRLLDYVQPHFVHVVMEGKVVKTADASLALLLEERGYDWLEPQTTGV